MTTTPPPIRLGNAQKFELDAVEKECDERNRRTGARFGKIEGRQQQLFGDPATKTGGILAQLQAGQEENKQIALSTKKEVTGIKVQLGGLLIALQIVIWLLSTYVVK